MTDTLTFQPPTDDTRRALIRYYTPFIQIFGEYIPQLINDTILPHPFTAKQLHNALTDIGIGHSRRGIYDNLQDPYNPITAPTPNQPPQTRLAQTYTLLPAHETQYLISSNAYFREFEVGHRHHIPPSNIFQSQLNHTQMTLLNQLYDKINWTPPPQKLKWTTYLAHFTSFHNTTRTPINNETITKPARFKLAFFEAMIKPGEYSYTDISLLTGIHHENLRHVLQKSKYTTDRHFLILHADSYHQAMTKRLPGEFIIPIGKHTFLLQTKTLLREKTPHELNQQHTPPNYTNTLHQHQQRYTYIQSKRKSQPTFQINFLLKQIKKIAKQAHNINLPEYINNLHDSLTFIQNQIYP